MSNRAQTYLTVFVAMCGILVGLSILGAWVYILSHFVEKFW